MPSLPFVTVDVFTKTRFAGNPLAIVNVPQGQHVSDQQMQMIAKEFNLSETVFLHEGSRDANGTCEWRMRIFLTDAEVPFVSVLCIRTGQLMCTLTFIYRLDTQLYVNPIIESQT